jgi:hypothetical protein
LLRLRDGGKAEEFANHLGMETCKQLSPVVAARLALARQQLVVLRDWLGDDHELMSWTRAQAVPDVPAVAPAVQQPEEMSA